LHFDNCIVGNEIAKVANDPARVALVTNVTQINKFLASVEPSEPRPSGSGPGGEDETKNKLGFVKPM
jgi:hypothetical protein